MRNLVINVFVCGVLAACSGENDNADSGATMPETESPEPSDDESWIFVDTGLSNPDSNTQPDQTLTIVHSGAWELSPVVSPYTSMTGQIEVIEYLDGDDDDLWCRAVFALTGQPNTAPCADCAFAFDVTFSVTAEGAPPAKTDTANDKNAKVGGVLDCLSPDLPIDDEIRTLGYIESDQMVVFNYFGTGIWVPWYAADLVGNDLSVFWSAELGFSMPEEDE